LPDLDEILKQTMVSAASKATVGSKLPFPVQDADPMKDVGIDFDFYGHTITHVDQHVLIEGNPVWSYKSPVFSSSDGGSVVRVESVKCCVRDMSYMAMPVFEEIEWGPVKVFSQSLGRELELPLTDEYLIRRRFIPGGNIPESSSGFWQLPAKVDQSWELIFGYEIPLFTSGKPGPLPEACWRSPNLMVPCKAMVCPAQPEHDHFNTLRIPPLRVVVCVSLVCCKERRDFDPGNLFGGGRIYPLIMAMSSLPLERITGAVRLSRPSDTMHTEMGGEKMSRRISGILFTDRNCSPSKIPPRPFWDNLFDYFLLDAYPGEYEVVCPNRSGMRTLKKATEVPASLIKWKSRDITKFSCQGEFDNIHFAPKMIVPDDIIKANPNLTGMDEVTMAPFCVHDCLHLHWRWGSGDTAKHNLGWEDDQKPYAKAGAPLVPANQKVALKMLSPVSCLYKAEAQAVPAGRWQVMMHHGAAYAVAAGGMADFVMSLFSTASDKIVKARPNWALFYWCLRNTFYDWEQVPRLKWEAGKLDELRKL
jgi:hypothetical protein